MYVNNIAADRYTYMGIEHILNLVKIPVNSFSCVATTLVSASRENLLDMNIFYMFRSDSVVDYHEIVKWAAKKLGVVSRAAYNLPTYELEKEIVTEFFAKLWENLSPEEKQELVDEMVKEGYLKSQGSKINYGDIAGQLWLFYQMNPELALALLAGAGTALVVAGSFLAALEPLGWAAIAAGGSRMASADVDTVSSFVVAVNMIKTRKYMK